jgi:hypothetical protein
MPPNAPKKRKEDTFVLWRCGAAEANDDVLHSASCRIVAPYWLLGQLASTEHRSGHVKSIQTKDCEEQVQAERDKTNTINAETSWNHLIVIACKCRWCTREMTNSTELVSSWKVNKAVYEKRM